MVCQGACSPPTSLDLATVPLWTGSAQASPWCGAASRIGPGPLRGSLTPPRPDACVLRCALHGPLAPVPIEGLGGCGPLTGDGRDWGVGCAWEDRASVGLATRHPAPWPGCHPLYGAIGPCWRLMGPEAHLPADRKPCPRSGAAEARAHLPGQERRRGGLRVAAVRLTSWGSLGAVPLIGYGHEVMCMNDNYLQHILFILARKLFMLSLRRSFQK